MSPIKWCVIRCDHQTQCGQVFSSRPLEQAGWYSSFNQERRPHNDLQNETKPLPNLLVGIAQSCSKETVLELQSQNLPIVHNAKCPSDGLCHSLFKNMLIFVSHSFIRAHRLTKEHVGKPVGSDPHITLCHHLGVPANTIPEHFPALNAFDSIRKHKSFHCAQLETFSKLTSDRYSLSRFSK